MMKTLRYAAVAAVAVSAVAAGVLAPSALAHEPRGLDAIGLSGDGNGLIAFNTADPDGATPIGTIMVTFPDGRLVGIDYRPSTGTLYGIGDRGGIYTLNDQTAMATKVGQIGANPFAFSNTLRYGIDFNPVADALRIVSSAGGNLRQPFQPGVDLPMGGTITDTPLNKNAQLARGVSAAAYTNNDNSAATPTQLFDLDTTDDQLVLQDPPNSGTLTGIGPVGALNTIDPNAGFDVYSTLDQSGATIDNDAFAVVGRYLQRLLAVNLATGEIEEIDVFNQPVVDLAIKLDQ